MDLVRGGGAARANCGRTRHILHQKTCPVDTPTSARSGTRSTSGPPPGRRTTRRSTPRRPASTRGTGSRANRGRDCAISVAAFPATQGRGHPQVDQLHRLRLAVLGRGRLQRRLHRRPPALGERRQRLQPPRELVHCLHPGWADSNPATGALITNSSGTAGLYSRSRGRGADDLVVTGAGLWVASDNFGGNTSCGGQSGYAGICFLPNS